LLRLLSESARAIAATPTENLSEDANQEAGASVPAPVERHGDDVQEPGHRIGAPSSVRFKMHRSCAGGPDGADPENASSLLDLRRPPRG